MSITMLTEKDKIFFKELIISNNIILRNEVVNKIQEANESLKQELRAEMKDQIEALRVEIQEANGSLRQELRTEMKDQIEALRVEIQEANGSLRQELRAEMKDQIKKLRAEVKQDTLTIIESNNKTLLNEMYANFYTKSEAVSKQDLLDVVQPMKENIVYLQDTLLALDKKVDIKFTFVDGEMKRIKEKMQFV